MVATDEKLSYRHDACDAFESAFFHCAERFAVDHCYGVNEDGDDDGTNYDDDRSIISNDVRSPLTSLRSADDTSALSRDDVEDESDEEEDEENDATAAAYSYNDDTVAYVKPKKRSDEEMEALYLKAKSLLVLKRYSAFVEALKDCQELLSFHSTKHGNATLLHLLSSQEVAPPEMYILQAISQDPSAVQLLDADGNSALHLSARVLNTSNLRAFFLFLKFCRSSAYQPNNSGDLPLHIAAATGSAGAEAGVAALLEINPTALTTRGARGKVPLHCAFAEGSGNTNILVEILAAHKEMQIGVIDFDDDGNTPLHAAIKHVAPYEALVTFRDELKEEETFISPFLTKNRNGDLPLHSALHLLVVDPRIIYLLLDAAPFAGTVKDSKGKMPVQSATAIDLPTNLVVDLLKMDMPITIGNKVGSMNERQHGHSWWHIAILSDDDGKFLGGISGLLDGATLAELIGLARSVGPDGKTLTIDAASDDLKSVFREKLRFLERYDVSTSHLPYERNGVQTYSATAIDPRDGENASTTLRCYCTLSPFLDEINVRKNYQVSPDFVEDMKASFKANQELVAGSAKVIAYVKPDLVLKELIGVTPLQKSTLSWLVKCNEIIKAIALALQNLHNSGLIHGHLEPSVVGCFSSSDDTTTKAWKLMEIGQSVKLGSAMSGVSFSSYFPPESIFDAQKRCLETHNVTGNGDNLIRTVRDDSIEPSSADKAKSWIKSKTYGQVATGVSSPSDASVSSIASSPRLSKLLPFKSRGRVSTWDDNPSIISTQEEEIKRLRQALIQKERELHMHTSTSPKNTKERKPPKSPTSNISSLGQDQGNAPKFVPESCLASSAWDAWALGIIMAQLLVPNDSFILPCAEATDELVMNRLSYFDMSDVRDIVGEVRCIAGNLAADLIGRLLDPNPETRLHSMSKVLRHRYFHEPVCEPMKPIDPSETDKKAKRATRFGKRKGHF